MSLSTTNIRDDVDLHTHVSRIVNTIPNIAQVSRIMQWSHHSPVAEVINELDMALRAFVSFKTGGEPKFKRVKSLTEYLKIVVDPVETQFERAYYKLRRLEEETHWSEDAAFMEYVDQMAEREIERQKAFESAKVLSVTDVTGELSFRINWTEAGMGLNVRCAGDSDAQAWVRKMAAQAEFVITRLDNTYLLQAGLAALCQFKAFDASYGTALYGSDEAKQAELLADMVRAMPAGCVLCITDAYDRRADHEVVDHTRKEMMDVASSD